MEQEPVYVLAGPLTRLCERVIGVILDKRQTDKETYVKSRVDAYNYAVHKANKWRSKLGWLGVTEKQYITPYGMELQIKAEMECLDASKLDQHPIMQIYRQYGETEHQAKDCMIQAKINDSVPVSPEFVRCVSHLNIDFAKMTARPAFGFVPTKNT